MKKSIITLAAALLLSGCASTIKDTSVGKRTFSMNIFNIITVDSETTDLVIGEISPEE